MRVHARAKMFGALAALAIPFGVGASPARAQDWTYGGSPGYSSGAWVTYPRSSPWGGYAPSTSWDCDLRGQSGILLRRLGDLPPVLALGWLCPVDLLGRLRPGDHASSGRDRLAGLRPGDGLGRLHHDSGRHRQHRDAGRLHRGIRPAGPVRPGGPVCPGPEGDHDHREADPAGPLSGVRLGAQRLPAQALVAQSVKPRGRAARHLGSVLLQRIPRVTLGVEEAETRRPVGPDREGGTEAAVVAVDVNPRPARRVHV